MNTKKLLDLREYHDLFQKDIAKILNVSQQSYSVWENGKEFIPLKHLNKLCNFYNISMDYLFDLSETKEYYYNIDTINKEYVGKNIQLIRKTHKLTIRDLAKDLNTSSSTITAYEKGRTLILTPFLYQICKKYHYSMDELIGRKTNN